MQNNYKTVRLTLTVLLFYNDYSLLFPIKVNASIFKQPPYKNNLSQNLINLFVFFIMHYTIYKDTLKSIHKNI